MNYLRLPQSASNRKRAPAAATVGNTLGGLSSHLIGSIIPIAAVAS